MGMPKVARVAMAIVVLGNIEVALEVAKQEMAGRTLDVDMRDRWRRWLPNG